MSNKEKSCIKEFKVSPSVSIKSEENPKMTENEKINNENLSDDENLSGFDSDSEEEGNQNGKAINFLAVSIKIFTRY